MCGVLRREDETIPASRERFYEPRLGRPVVERPAQHVNRLVQSTIEVDERVGRPQPQPELLPSHHVTRVLEKRKEDLKRLVLQLHSGAPPAQFAGMRIERELAEMNQARHGTSGF